jgi:hypothetical protein
MHTASIARRAVLLGALTLSATTITAAQGVVNGGFTTRMTAASSPWFQYYPAGIREEPANPGVQMRDGRLFLQYQRRQGNTDACPQWADIAIYQAGIQPLNTSPDGEIVELEFALKMTPASGYSCTGSRFEFMQGETVPAVEACVWSGAVDAPVASYRRLGSEFTVATEDADGAWRRYRAAWQRGSSDSTTRYMVTLRLADLGESMLLEIDETTGDAVYLRANQVLAEIDNVQLTLRSGDGYTCPLVPGGVSLDVLSVAGATARPVTGGSFSGTGPVVGCVEPCRGDLNLDGSVSGADLGILLGAWGGAGNADLNGDGTVNGADLGILLGVWGACPDTQAGGI